MTETDLSSLSVEEIFRFLESNNADVVAEVQAFFHQNLSHTKEGWLVVLSFCYQDKLYKLFCLGYWSL